MPKLTDEAIKVELDSYDKMAESGEPMEPYDLITSALVELQLRRELDKHARYLHTEECCLIDSRAHDSDDECVCGLSKLLKELEAFCD